MGCSLQSRSGEEEGGRGQASESRAKQRRQWGSSGSGVETMIVAGAMGKTVASDAQQDPTRGYRCCKRAASVAEVAGQR
ncbi:hypothetical protein GW17_00035674 [Ensete ventricosum]|nr:hypothetical protein GW17_00035674 [Ensete ventricosum]